MVRQGYKFAISTITKYEIYTGATQSQLVFWDDVLSSITVIPFDESCVDVAVSINAALKRKRKQIDLADLFIAATAMSRRMSFATLNKKHFDRIDAVSYTHLDVYKRQEKTVTSRWYPVRDIPIVRCMNCR